MMDPRIQRAREEQIRLAALLQSGHPESEGIELAISDWFWEEMLVQREQDRHVMTPSSLRQPAGQGRREAQVQHPGATWANVALKPATPCGCRAVKKPPALAWRQELRWLVPSMQGNSTVARRA